MKVRQAVLLKLLPDVHRLAPDLNGSFVRQTVIRGVEGSRGSRYASSTHSPATLATTVAS